MFKNGIEYKAFKAVKIDNPKKIATFGWEIDEETFSKKCNLRVVKVEKITDEECRLLFKKRERDGWDR